MILYGVQVKGFGEGCPGKYHLVVVVGQNRQYCKVEKIYLREVNCQAHELSLEAKGSFGKTFWWTHWQQHPTMRRQLRRETALKPKIPSEAARGSVGELKPEGLRATGFVLIGVNPFEHSLA